MGFNTLQLPIEELLRLSLRAAFNFAAPGACECRNSAARATGAAAQPSVRYRRQE
jgi:hypothetical protein